MIPSIRPEEAEPIEEYDGSMSSDFFDQKLMHSVLEADKDSIDDGKLATEAINHGVSNFMPDLMFEKLTKDYALTKELFGERIIRLLSGYNPDYIKRNLNIPEFRRELYQQLSENIEGMKKRGILNKQGDLDSSAYQLSALIMYTEELDALVAKGFGERERKEKSVEGDKEDVRMFRKGDRYRDISTRRSITQALRRGHEEVKKEDLISHERRRRGAVHLIYAIDASGSMKGKKIEAAKKAGIALAYRAISKKDPVGLLEFGDTIKNKVSPTLGFSRLLWNIAGINAFKETNITASIEEAINLFSDDSVTRHLILLTDAMPTVGKKPEKEVLEAVSKARDNNITVSLIGIDLDEQGVKLAEEIARVGDGRFYIIRDVENLDTIILDDYHSQIS